MVNETSIVAAAVAQIVPCRACDGFTESADGICECCSELGVFVYEDTAYQPRVDNGVLLEDGMCLCGNAADATDDECRECIEQAEREMQASWDDDDEYADADNDFVEDYDWDDGRFDQFDSW